MIITWIASTWAVASVVALLAMVAIGRAGRWEDQRLGYDDAGAFGRHQAAPDQPGRAPLFSFGPGGTSSIGAAWQLGQIPVRTTPHRQG
ncbi:hypothetical protein [Modestobacter sp. SYSU DS0657]